MKIFISNIPYSIKIQKNVLEKMCHIFKVPFFVGSQQSCLQDMKKSFDNVRLDLLNFIYLALKCGDCVHAKFAI